MTNLLDGWIKDHIRSLKFQLALQQRRELVILFVCVFHEVLKRAVDAVEKSIKNSLIKILDVVPPHWRLFISLKGEEREREKEREREVR